MRLRFSLKLSRALTIGCVALVLASACASRGPNRIRQDRANYGQAIGDSWKVQNLLNIVRLRYLDWPTFLEVDQVAAAYTWNVNGALQGQIKTVFGADSDQVTATIGGSFQERPTILYKPLGGERFVDSMLTPVRPDVLFALVQSGFGADLLLETMLHSVNGAKNLSTGADAVHRPEPGFMRFVRVIHRLQRENALSFHGSAKAPPAEAGESVSTPDPRDLGAVRFYVDRMSADTRSEFDAMRQDLGISPDVEAYRLAWGLLAPDTETIAVQTRSMLAFLVSLTFFVDVPADHQADGRAPKVEKIPEDAPDGGKRWLRVHSGREAPEAAFVAVRYEDRWFWIDRADSLSKRTFAYLSLLLTVTEGGQSGGTPLVLTVN